MFAKSTITVKIKEDTQFLVQSKLGDIKHRQRERDRERQREKKGERERKTDRETERQRHRKRQTKTETNNFPSQILSAYKINKKCHIRYYSLYGLLKSWDM